MAEQKQNYYVVSLDLLFLGIHVEAGDEQEAREKAMAFLNTPPPDTVGIEAAIRDVTVRQIEPA